MYRIATEAGAAAPSAPGSARLEGRVLLALPQPDEAQRIARLLSARGARVDQVADGAGAVTAALSTCYDLMLLDEALTDGAGNPVVELLVAVGNEEPKVAIGRGDGGSVRTDAEEYCDRLAWPASEHALLAVARRHLAAGSDDPGSGGGWRTTDAFAALVQDYRRSLPDAALELWAAADAGDLAALAGLAHRMKGTAGNLGLAGLSGAAARVQAAAGSTWSVSLDEALQALESELVALDRGGHSTEGDGS